MAENVIKDKASGQYQTVGLETAVVLPYALLQNFSGKVNFTVVGKDISNGDSYVGEASLAVKRSSGAGSIVGEVVYSLPIQADVSMETAFVSTDIYGSALTISVSGILEKTIDWWVDMNIDGIQDNS